MRPEDLAAYRTIDSVDLSPDGFFAVYSQSVIDLADNIYVRSLWLAGGESRQLTEGPSDKQPRWSPDGTSIAFLRTVEGTDQLALMAADGGDVELVTAFEEKVVAFDWAPDSQRLVVQAQEHVDGFGHVEEERDRPPRRITRFPYRFDDPRWDGTTVDHLWIVARGAEPIRLTSGTVTCEGPKWSPTGEHIAFLSDRSGRLFGSTSKNICIVASGGGDVEAASDAGLFDEVSYRRDGVIHAVGLQQESDWPSPTQLLRLADHQLEAVAPHVDRTIVGAGVAWIADDAVYAVEDGGKQVVVRVSPTGKVVRVFDEKAGVRSLAVGGDRLAIVSTTYRDPSQLVVVGDTTSVWAQPNADLDIGLVDGDYFQVSTDGVEVDAWVYLPPGEDPVPLLLNIHGGPAGAYGFGFFDEFQMLVGAGYGVVACNPRGSSGRGESWMKAVTGDGWGVRDLSDIQAVVDAALDRHRRLDASRKGIMGGSYGGFLTAWTVAHDNSYQSAVVERALLNWISFAGTSDIAATFPGMYLEGSSMPADFERLWHASPIRLANEIETPTLIVHSEGDYRCPIEQAEQLFAILLRNGVATEFLRFPGESHELSRSGTPQHRLQRVEAILEWHSRFLS